MLSKKLCTGLITELMKGPAGLFNSLSLNAFNVSTYRPLSGSSYIKLPVELKSPEKGLINSKITIKNVFIVSC